MSNLLTFLEDYQKRYGIGKLVVMNQLRQYVIDTPFPTVLEEVQHIFDVRDLKVLIGVGMRGALYYAVVAQMARVEGLV